MRAWAVPVGVRPPAGAPAESLYAGAQVIRAADGQCYGWELLARRVGHPPSEGAGPALARLAETFDRLSLDTFMVREAAALALATNDERLLVNLSVATATDPTYRDRFLDAAAVAAAAAGRYRIGVEVHEDIDWERAEFNHFIDALHARGLLAVLDDFRGTRTCWKKSCARWDVIKLDCASMPSAQAIAAIDVLKDGLGVPKPAMLIAEAVESACERERLLEAGAHAVQGFVAGVVTAPGSPDYPGAGGR